MNGPPAPPRHMVTPRVWLRSGDAPDQRFVVVFLWASITFAVVALVASTQRRLGTVLLCWIVFLMFAIVLFLVLFCSSPPPAAQVPRMDAHQRTTSAASNAPVAPPPLPLRSVLLSDVVPRRGQLDPEAVMRQEFLLRMDYGHPDRLDRSLVTPTSFRPSEVASSNLTGVF